MPLQNFSALDLLSTAVLWIDAHARIVYANSAAENLLKLSNKRLPHEPITDIFPAATWLSRVLRQALANNLVYVEHEVPLMPAGGSELLLDCIVTPVVQAAEPALILEMRPLNQQIKAQREERLQQERERNRELIRNLAHEIKNPLGGIRGAAQLLEGELQRNELKEYTRVIIAEADRLQVLLNRLLAARRPEQKSIVNVHELLERVRTLLLAEYPNGLTIARDYDASLPEIEACGEQLIQALLNIARNAAQALAGHGSITLRTRIEYKVTLNKRRFRLAIRMEVIDNGPGVAAALRDKIFYPLVSGREDGTGLGLTIAQDFVMQQGGLIEVESEPGHTCFAVVIPILATEHWEGSNA